MQKKLITLTQDFIKRYSDKFLSKWIVLVFDVSVVAMTFMAAYIIRFNFDVSQINPERIQRQIGLVTLCYLASFFIIRSFAGIIRHTSWNDAYRIFKAGVLAFFILIGGTLIAVSAGSESLFIPPVSVLLIHFMLNQFILIGSRLLIKTVFIRLKRNGNGKKVGVIIYGAGAAGMLTRNALLQDVHINYEIIAFVDDNPGKYRKRLDGVPVLSQSIALKKSYIEQNEVTQLIIAIQNIELGWKQKIIEKGLELNLQVKVLPSVDDWINGELSSRQLRPVRIEELLEREVIKLDDNHLHEELKDRIILVTGAAGSIGSEIARQVLRYAPKRVILLDQAESPLYELQFEINNDAKLKPYSNQASFVIANVKDKFRMEQIFNQYKPEIIYHAAAYKHVPLMEQNPYEAVYVNVFGTKTLADLAVRHGVRKFIMVSTDKAVNPTNIMGATKRIAEIYTQSIRNTRTQFVTTRFGNVLGSNGSVIPLFRKQIQNGGPITITHKDIIRYFMTIPEACNLVLEAGSMGKGGEIFVFDMGKPVKIYNLAKKMIQLSGLHLGLDIEIIETGLRPGEKLFEELLSNKENTVETHHPKIMIARVEPYDEEDVLRFIHKLSEVIIERDEFKLVGIMKEIVPEFISNNSIYQKLDKKVHEKK